MNIHRLFINLSGDGSSQAGSSPIRPTTGGSSSKGKDREVMGLARRAKGLTAEVKGMNADSAEEDMEGGMRRMKQLEEDLVSVKAVEGIKVSVVDPTVGLCLQGRHMSGDSAKPFPISKRHSRLIL